MIIIGFTKENSIDMTRKHKSITLILFSALAVLCFSNLNAQCNTWMGSPEEGKLTDAHTIYRGHMKAKDLDSAFEHWKIAYEGAPAADGKRDFHYTDGIKIYKHLLAKETDETKKEAHKAMILKLYDEVIACFENGSIKMKIPAEERVAYLHGRKAFDMYYDLRTPYTETYQVLSMAVTKGGPNTEYIVLAPYADVTCNLFGEKELSPEEARKAYSLINEIADHNITNNEKYGSYYKQAKESALGTFAPYENHIFDCAYFKAKVQPQYDANPDDPANIKECIKVLKRQGCDASDPLLTELENKWSKYAASENAKRQAEFESSNPAMMAKKAYDSGDYAGAIAKYQEAISNESDATKQGEYYFRIASIKGRKLKKYNDARADAKKAAQLKPNWGRPWMLIGDLYAKGSRNCGDSFMQRCAVLAAIDKYSKAKSVDPSMASEASERIGKYSGSKPTQEEAFMRGYKSGSSVKVSCWIGETVKIRF